MKKSAKFISLFLAISVLLFTLTGCGGSSESSGTESSAAESTTAESAGAESTEAENTEAESTEAENTGAETTEAESEAPESTASESAEAENTVVRLGVTGAVYEDLWAPTIEKLAGEGITLELVQFSDFALPNNALDSGDIEMNAFQHHAYFENDKSTNNYDIDILCDTFTIAMNLFSSQYSAPEEIPEGGKVAVPNDATNYGRALLLLRDAGLLTLREGSGSTPTTTDIETSKIELVEVNASMTYQYLDDSEIAATVINGNYAASYGVDPQTAIFYENLDPDDNSFICVVAVRSEDLENETYKKVADTFRSEDTIKLFEEKYKGYFVPAWEQ